MKLSELKRNIRTGDYIHSVKDRLIPVFTLSERKGARPYAYVYDGSVWVVYADEVLGRATEVEVRENVSLNNLI